MQAYSRQVQQAAAAPGDRSVQSSAAGQSSTNSDAIKQRIAGDTSTLQKRARQRAEAARRQAADDASAITGITGDESYHMRDMDAYAAAFMHAQNRKFLLCPLDHIFAQDVSESHPKCLQECGRFDDV